MPNARALAHRRPVLGSRGCGALPRGVFEQAQEARAEQVRSNIRSYIDDYGSPLVTLITRVSPATARNADTVNEGQLRISQITSETDEIARAAAVSAATRSADASRLAHQATVGGVVAFILTPILLILLGIWLARLVAEPLRRMVDAASSVASGTSTFVWTSVAATSSAS